MTYSAGMSSSRNASARLILGSQYFLYFGVMGVFLPFFNLYCYHLGFSGWQIGTLSAVRSITLVVFSLLWGALADRYRARRPIYIGCHLISTIIWGAYLLTTEFTVMVAITVLYGIFYSPLISFLEAFAMDVLGDDKRRYGRLRVWGSVSFIGTVLIMGRVIDIASIRIVLVLILAGSAALAALSPSTPRQQMTPITPQTGELKPFLAPRISLFLVSAFLMLVSHGAYYGFFSIHLENLGYGSTLIGICWALASISEILVMIGSGAIFSRFSLERVLMLTFFAATARWLVLGLSSSIAAILLSQLLHALTYGAFHVASILYIDRASPETSKTVGQAVNNAVTYGLGLMTGFFVGGLLYEPIGTFAMFQVSAGISLMAAGVFGLLRWAGGRG